MKKNNINTQFLTPLSFPLNTRLYMLKIKYVKMATVKYLSQKYKGKKNIDSIYYI